MKISPLQDRVIVKRSKALAESEGGIIIPDNAKEKPLEGRVVAIGPGKLTEAGKRLPMETKKGDKVLFAKYAGIEVQVGGETHLLLREDELLCILEG